MSQPDENGPGRVEIALLALLLLGLIGALIHWREPLAGFLSLVVTGDEEQIRAWARSIGPSGPLVTIALNVAQVLLAPVPGQIVGIANGYLYGLWLGTLYSMIGLLIGTALAMVLARRFGRPLVQRLARPEQLERWDAAGQRQGPLFFFLVFLLPSLPDDLICLLVGLSRLDLRRMLVLAMIGRFPGVLVSCWVGARASSLPPLAWAPMAVGAGLLAWLFWRNQDKLEEAGTRLVNWITAVCRRSRRD
jgi:uncharacterized membrane protein YdjX (TVP38/TMEM64 family)